MYSDHGSSISKEYLNTYSPTGRVYILVLLDARQEASPVPLYIPEDRIIPHFAVVFLPSHENRKSTICTSKFENSVPILSTMKCSYIDPSSDLTSYYATIMMPSGWMVDWSATYNENKDNSYSATRYILYEILMYKFNFTEVGKTDCLKPECFRIKLVPDVPNIVKFAIRGSIVALETTEYAFVTCHYKEDLSFKFYTKPFQNLVWVGIALSLGTLVIVGEAFVTMKFEEHRFFVLFYFLTTVLEQAAQMTTEVMRTNFFRLLVIGWLVSATSLTNGYRSLMISSLNAPSVPIFPKMLEVSG